MNEIVNAISNVGFPIVCTGFLFYFCNKTLSDMKDTIDKNTDAFTKLQETIIKYFKKEGK